MEPIPESSFIQRFHLAFPALVLLIALCEIGLSVRVPVPVAFFLAGFVFLNSSHVGFLLVFFLFHPNYRRWATQRYGSQGRLYLQMFLVVFVSALIFYFSGKTPGLALFFLFLIIAWNVFHGLMQTYGLLNQYGVEGKYDAASARRERKLFLAFFCAFLSGRVLANFPLGLSPEFIRAAQWALVPVLLTLLVLLVVEARRISANRPNEKTFFVLRLILYPLVPFSTAAAAGIVAYHGVEYLFVTQKILRHTEEEATQRKIVVGCAAIALTSPLIGILPFFHRWGLIGEAANWERVVLMIFGPLAFLHYYLEGQLFRMKNPESRLEIAPLLRG